MRLNNIPNYNINFKGYDARPMKALAITSPGYNCEIARELERIAEVGNFKLQILTGNKLKDLAYIDELVPTPEDVRKRQEEFYRKYNGLIKNGMKINVNSNPEPPRPRGFKPSKGTCVWAQDINTVTPSGKVVGNPQQMTLARNIAALHNLKAQVDYDWLPGGNIYYIRNSKGKDELLAGKHERRKISDEDTKEIDYEKLKNFYGVNKITFLPQLDFHIDLYVRPLDNKRILVADDNLTLKVLQDGIKKVTKAFKECTDTKKAQYLDTILEKLEILEGEFLCTVATTKFSRNKKLKKILKANGFTVIPVPGRLYDMNYSSTPCHKMNYMNGIALKNDNDELVYITNKSKVDVDLGITPQLEKELDFSMEKAFKDSVAEYIKPENIFFVSGLYNEIADNLTKKRGGIHCMVTEIPKEDDTKNEYVS